jgi:endonuclease YncB( thermonuclease family)
VIRKIFVWLVLIGLLLLWAFSDEIFPPETVRAADAAVVDGDTLVLNHRTYRLYGIDAPEYHQSCKDKDGNDWACGKAARAQMIVLVAPGSLICYPQAMDKYGRTVATCASATIPDLGAAMARAGLATAPGPPEFSNVYQTQSDEAKAARRGIWQGSFDAPADWRAAHPRSSLALPPKQTESIP